MKAFQLTLVLIAVGVLVNWLRAGSSFHVVETLPLLGGHKPSLYDAAGAVLGLMLLWGLWRLRRRGEH